MKCPGCGKVFTAAKTGAKDVKSAVKAGAKQKTNTAGTLIVGSALGKQSANKKRK